MRTASRPKKHRCRRYRSRTSPHRLVNPGNPPHRHAACATAHQSCPYHCLVALAAGSSGRRKALASEMENATVVLGAHNLTLNAGSTTGTLAVSGGNLAITAHDINLTLAGDLID